MSVKLTEGAEKAVTEEITGAMNRTHEEIMEWLNDTGTEAVKKARLIVTEGGGGGSVLPPYTVRSSNLVSSTGFAVVYNGKIMNTSSFDAVGGPDGDGQEGSATGRAYVKELAMRYPTGYALILVAGMHYASYVQELYHKDVLVSGSLVAEQLVMELQNDFNNKK